MFGANLSIKMNLSKQLLAQAEEYRIYAAAECAPASKEQWIKWADTCEAAFRSLEIREASVEAQRKRLNSECENPYKGLLAP